MYLYWMQGNLYQNDYYVGKDNCLVYINVLKKAREDYVGLSMPCIILYFLINGSNLIKSQYINSVKDYYDI